MKTHAGGLGERGDDTPSHHEYSSSQTPGLAKANFVERLQREAHSESLGHCAFPRLWHQLKMRAVLRNESHHSYKNKGKFDGVEQNSS